MRNAGRRGNRLGKNRLWHEWFLNREMLLLPAFQTLEGFPVKVDNLDGCWNELDFRADLFLAHGGERSSAAFADPLIFRQSDEFFFMRKYFQDLFYVSTLFFPTLMRWHLNGGFL